MAASDCTLALALAAALTLAGCAAPEQAVLERFFGASRLRDTAALQAVAAVAFEPRQDGIVRSFAITAVTPEQIEGGAVTKEVTVEAPVIRPDGRTVRKTLVVRMERARGDGARWMVTGFRDAAASGPAPPP